MQLGVCYYPEHWPQQRWSEDAAMMREMGLTHVRIGEFSWSRLEPEPGQLEWQWLDDALDVLHAAGLKVILGTPTATPPKWLVDRHPEMLARDEQGKPRGFGSRRHYSFASLAYRQESKRIVTLMAQRYGGHPAIVAWQTDNEYGCHNTVVSYAEVDLLAFRHWLAQRYGEISALNQAWGNVFWSMEYRSFEEIELPNLTVTESNPAHRMDFRRCCSDQVVAFNQEQVYILRQYAPDTDLVHNYMGFYTEFDHHKVGRDLDVASWDSYPLGFLDQEALYRHDEKQAYLRTGHPDFGAFHHDLYRGCSQQRLWIMEQQPGPVNWAPHNPAPMAGAVRLWTWEAFSHGAELVSYFRWRQAPFAQEQMHAGLLRPDASKAEAAQEAEQVAQEVKALAQHTSLDNLPVQGQVALMFDYQSQWSIEIQPQSDAFHYQHWCYRVYEALRELGLSVDIIGPEADLQNYAMLVLPAQIEIDEALNRRLQNFQGTLLVGPRSGSKTQDYQIPQALPPGRLSDWLKVTVERVDALPPGAEHEVYGSWGSGHSSVWREQIRTQAPVWLSDRDGSPVLSGESRHYYLGACLDNALLKGCLEKLANEANLMVCHLPRGVRMRQRGDLAFVFNYSDHPASFSPLNSVPLLGSANLPAAGVSIWKKQH